MSKTKKIKTAVGVADRTDPYYALGSSRVESDKFWRWGDDNLFPTALALMSRRSTTHRRIINDKADYISGKGFSCDEGHEPLLAAFIRRVNGDGESLRQVLNKLAFDKALFGNAFLEIVTDAEHSFLAFHHQDASRCRVARDSAHILLHHDWAAFNAAEARTLPLYPTFERQEDGTLRAMIHYKDYEPMFEHYGVPPYIAGFNVSAIAYMAAHTGESIFNLGTGRGYGVLEMVHAFEAANHVHVPYRIAPRRAGDLPTVYACPDKSARILGWRADYSLEDMCRDSWRWQTQNPNGYETA